MKNNKESVIICQEIHRSALKKYKASDIRASIETAILKNSGIAIEKVLLLKQGQIPRTSSGKIKRQLTKKMVEDTSLRDCEDTSKRVIPVIELSADKPIYPLIENTIISFIKLNKEVPDSKIDKSKTLAQFGIDSVLIHQMQYMLEDTYKKQLDTSLFLENPTIETLAKHIENATNKLETKEESYTFDMFSRSPNKSLSEVTEFSQWVNKVKSQNLYHFEEPRLSAQTKEALTLSNKKIQKVLNLSTYNYIGLANHQDVITAAKLALDMYGLGASGSPLVGGKMKVHLEFEDALLKFLDIPNAGVSLFNSGYSANLGVLPALFRSGHIILLDEYSHMSLVEGAKLSGAQIMFFKHNDMDDLETVLKRVGGNNSRTCICTEGIYSGEGDVGKIKEIVALAKKYDALTLVDEAHSMLLSGPNGRGESETQGVLHEVDLIIITMSKGFGGIGGALIANKDITTYINWYAKSRMFSCALDPAVSGGMVKSIELAGSEYGKKRRETLQQNALYFNTLLKGKVAMSDSTSWIQTVTYGSEKKSLPLKTYLLQEGLDISLMQYPAVPKDSSRIRLFITSELTKSDLEKAAGIILKAAKKLDFLI